jgi:hypothetical protein
LNGISIGVAEAGRLNTLRNFRKTGRKIIVTNAFTKKSRKLDPAQKAKALRAKADYETRVNLGEYYA